MKLTVVDTDILSMFFRGHEKVVERFDEYLDMYDRINISIITYYEIMSGLKYRDAQKQLGEFQRFLEYVQILPLTVTSIDASADIYAKLRRRGDLIDDIDILIAGVAIVNEMVIATNNERHFDRIDGLQVHNWNA